MPRNSSGTYSLPAGNPVSSGTLIEASWANNTLSDLASSMTNSLSRNGEGGMLAPLRVADGSVSTPGLAFTNETSSGLYRAGSGDIRLSITGAQVVQFLATGMAVTGTLSSTGNASVGGTLAVTGASTLTGALAANGGVTTTTVAASGNATVGGTLGVTGATTLSANLVFGSTGQRIVADFSNSTPANRTFFQTSTTNGATIVPAMPNGSETTSIFRAYNSSSPNNASYGELRAGPSAIELIANREGSGALLPLTISTGNATRVTVDTSGNVGIGVTPSAWGTLKAMQFPVGSIAAYDGGNTSRQINLINNAFFDGSNFKYVASDTAQRYTLIDGQHRWYTAPSGTAGNAISFTQAMTLDAGGRLGIGNTSPQTTLGLASQSTISWGTTNYPFISGDQPNNILTFGTQATERARIDSSGNFLCGTTSSTAPNPGVSTFVSGAGNSQIIVGHSTSSGSGQAYAAFLYNAGTIGSITQSGTTAVLYNTTSDHRLKTNVQPLTGALAKVAALNPSEFDWIDGRHDDGFIAHELQAVLPNVVTGDKDAVDEQGNPKYQQVDYARIVPTLTAAIQELHAKVQALEARLASDGPSEGGTVAS